MLRGEIDRVSVDNRIGLGRTVFRGLVHANWTEILHVLCVDLSQIYKFRVRVVVGRVEPASRVRRRVVEVLLCRTWRRCCRLLAEREGREEYNKQQTDRGRTTSRSDMFAIACNAAFADGAHGR